MTNKANTPDNQTAPRTKNARITANIEKNKELLKRLKTHDFLKYYSIEDFIKDAQTYIDAIKTRRINCIIRSVSRSGMYRNIKFFSIEKSNHQKKQFYTRNYFAFFIALGYNLADKYSDDFKIGGCGMDMIFYTNYTIIHKLHRLGFIDKKTCEKLAQATPTVI